MQKPLYIHCISLCTHEYMNTSIPYKQKYSDTANVQLAWQLLLSQDNPKPLKVVVFHYLQWPHHSRPTIPTFLQLMGEVERSQHKAKGPTLVMCK